VKLLKDMEAKCLEIINHHPDCGCVTGTFCSIKKNHKKGFFIFFSFYADALNGADFYGLKYAI